MSALKPRAVTPSGQPQRIRNNNVSSKTGVVLSGAIILFIAMGVGVTAAWWFFQHGSARLLLTNQKATVVLPEPIPVTADILNDLAIVLEGKLTTTVPIDQNVTIPIKDTLHVMATLDHDVPIKMNVPIHDTVMVDQLVHVDTTVGVKVLGKTLNLPIKGDVPIKTEVPINLEVPVDQMVHLKFTAPADVKLTQALNVPLKADIHTTIPLHSKMNVPVKSALKANVSIADPVEAIVTHAELKLPLHDLGLSYAEQQAEAKKAEQAEQVKTVAKSGALP